MGILIRVLAIVIALIVALLVGTRFLDGPIGLVPGGALRSGELVSGQEPNWSFVRDVREVELQLLDPAASRIAPSRMARVSGLLANTLYSWANRPAIIGVRLRPVPPTMMGSGPVGLGMTLMSSRW